MLGHSQRSWESTPEGWECAGVVVEEVKPSTSIKPLGTGAIRRVDPRAGARMTKGVDDSQDNYLPHMAVILTVGGNPRERVGNALATWQESKTISQH